MGWFDGRRQLKTLYVDNASGLARLLLTWALFHTRQLKVN